MDAWKLTEFIKMLGKDAVQKNKCILIHDYNLYLIPDTLILEIVANGGVLPSTSGVQIGDRSVLVYKMVDPTKGPDAGLLSFGDAPEQPQDAA